MRNRIHNTGFRATRSGSASRRTQFRGSGSEILFGKKYDLPESEPEMDHCDERVLDDAPEELGGDVRGSETLVGLKRPT